MPFAQAAGSQPETIIARVGFAGEDLPEIRKVGRDGASAQAERREQRPAAGDRTIGQQDSVARGREVRELLVGELPIDHDAGHTPDRRKNRRRVEVTVAMRRR